MVWFIFLYAVLVVLGVSFGDRGWYEPDGIAILSGSVNLAQAKAGNFFLYNYYYQPLTYEVNYLIYSLFQRPCILYLLPALFGSLAVCLLTFSVYLSSGRRINRFFSFCLLLFFPEIFFRLLYPNSSVFAMVFFALSLLLLFWKNSRQSLAFPNDIKYVFAGILASLACFFRFDFLLGIPALLFIIIFKVNRRRSVFAFSLGSFFIFVTAFFSGIFKPAEILKYYNFHIALNQSLDWSALDSFLVFFSITNCLIWGIFTIYFLSKLSESIIKRERRFLFILAALAILCYPVFGKLVSGHYLLTAVCFGPLVLAAAIIDFSRRALAKRLKLNFNRVVYAVAAFSILVQFLSVELDSHFPYLKITGNPAYAITHDGLRVFGAYLRGYRQVNSSNQAPYWRDSLALSQGIANLVSSSKPDFVIIGAREMIPENYLLSVTAYSLAFFLQIKGYELEFSPQGFILRGKHNRVFIQSLGLSEYRHFSQKNIPASAKLIKLPLISRRQVIFENPLKEFWAQILRL